MKIALKDILNNPHRDLTSNPLNEEKIEKLRASIKDTGFWDNVLVRKSEDNPGKFEVAYGHHRVDAARREGLEEADFIVKELSYDMMLEVMSRENDEAYGNDLRSTIESVSALVKAVAAGLIDAKKIAPEEHQGAREDTYRFAPSYIVGKKPRSEGKLPSLPYTTLSVAKFLGFVEVGRGGDSQAEPKVKAALAALEMQEAKLWTKSDLGKFRTEDGVIPVDRVIKASKDTQARANLIVVRTRVRAEQAIEQGKVTTAMLTAAQAEEKANAEEMARLVAKKATAIKAKAEHDAKVALEAIEASKARAKETEERLKLTKEMEKVSDKEIAATKAAETKATKIAENAAAAQWESTCKTLRDELDRIMSPGDALYGKMNLWKFDKRVTDPQRALLKLALRDASNRLANFNPDVTTPAAWRVK